MPKNVLRTLGRGLPVKDNSVKQETHGYFKCASWQLTYEFTDAEVKNSLFNTSATSQAVYSFQHNVSAKKNAEQCALRHRRGQRRCHCLYLHYSEMCM